MKVNTIKDGIKVGVYMLLLLLLYEGARFVKVR